MQQQRDEEIRAKLLAEDRVARLVAEKEAEIEDLKRHHAMAVAHIQVSAMTNIVSKRMFTVEFHQQAERDAAQRELAQAQQWPARPISMFEVPKTPGLFNYRRASGEGDVEAAKPQGVDLSGWVMIPSGDGVRRGWRQMRLAVRGNRLMFHEHKDRIVTRRDRQLPVQWFRCPEEAAQSQASVVLDLAAKDFKIVAVR